MGEVILNPVKQIFSSHAALHTSTKMGDFKSYLCIGCCAFAVGIVIMSIALIATSLRKLKSDEGRFDISLFTVNR